jgi:DNA-nicking Smr family endonuclease
MKTPKQKTTKTKQEDNSPHSRGISESKVFNRLMDDFGVSPLTENRKKEKYSNPQKNQPASNPVEFRTDTDLDTDSYTRPDPDKFSGKASQPDRNKHIKKKKITRNFQPDATIDLHGNTREEAIRRVDRFLKQSILQNCDSVLIITGKGTNQDNKPGILQKTIWRWLQKQKEEENISFKWAPYFLGGKGAILVFL